MNFQNIRFEGAGIGFVPSRPQANSSLPPLFPPRFGALTTATNNSQSPFAHQENQGDTLVEYDARKNALLESCTSC